MSDYVNPMFRRDGFSDEEEDKFREIIKALDDNMGPDYIYKMLYRGVSEFEL